MRVLPALFGGLLIALGVAARIVAARHHPFYAGDFGTPERRVGWTFTTFDVVRGASTRC